MPQQLKRRWIYPVGIAVLGLACGILERKVQSWVLPAVAIFYLLVFRWFAEKFGRP